MNLLKILLPFWTLLCAATAFSMSYSNVDPIMKWTEVYPNKYVKDVSSDYNHHALALLRWTIPTEKCDLITRTHTFDNQIFTKMCKVSSPFEYGSVWVVPESITFLKSNRSVLIYWKETHKTEGDRMKLQIILTDTCQSSPYIHVKASTNEAVDYKIVKFKKTFDVLFFNEEPGPRFVKLAFDFYGAQLIDKPEPLFIESDDGFGLFSIRHAYSMDFNKKEDYVLVGEKEDFRSGTYKQVYSPISGWFTTEDINEKFIRYAYSNSSGYATICWFIPKEIRCKRLDEIPRYSDEPVDFARVLVNRWVDYRSFTIYNKPNGELVLLYGARDHLGLVILVDVVADYGECRRIAKIVIPDPLHKVEISFVDDNIFCLSYISKGNDTDYSDTFEFSSGCYQEYFMDRTSECGNAWLPREPNQPFTLPDPYRY